MAAERYVREKAEFDEKSTKREAKEKETDEKSRIMPVSGGGFEQCYNAQAGVDSHTMLLVAATFRQAPNDKQQVQPMIKVLQEQEAKLGTTTNSCYNREKLTK